MCKKYYVDGASNKAKRIYYVLVTEETGTIIDEKIFDEHKTSNEIEYEAILLGIDKAEDGDIIYSDSQLCVNQISGLYKTNGKNLNQYLLLIHTKLKKKNVQIKWVRRIESPAGKEIDKKIKNLKNQKTLTNRKAA